jgi:hypothetical protein
MAINQVTQARIDAIRQNSIISLPNEPSKAGFTAEHLKNQFIAPIIGGSNSVVAELNRVIREINALLPANASGTNKLLAEHSIADILEQANVLILQAKETIDGQIDNFETALDEMQDLIDEYTETLESITTDGELNVPAWALQPTKPAYTASEVGALSSVPAAAQSALGGVKARLDTKTLYLRNDNSSA